MGAMQDYLWPVEISFFLLAVGAGFGEHRRRKRRDFDAVGFMPWTLVQFLAILAGLMYAGFALHA